MDAGHRRADCRRMRTEVAAVFAAGPAGADRRDSAGDSTAHGGAATGRSTSARRAAAGRHSACGRARRSRRTWWRTRKCRTPASAARADSGRDAEAGRSDHLGDDPEPGSAHRSQGRYVGRRTGRMEHPDDLDDAAIEGFAGRDAFGSRVHREVRDPGELQRLRDLGHLESREAHAGERLCLPGVAERRVGLQEPAVHVVGSDRQPDGLQVRRHP